MKKYIRLAFIYAMAAIGCGVFYREFTKYSAFTGRTTLAFTHLHLFGLGTLVFLIVALFVNQTDLEEKRQFHGFMILYNIGLPFMTVMFFVRGILQVRGTTMSAGTDAAVSGIAGIAHTLMTAAIVLLFVSLMKAEKRS